MARRRTVAEYVTPAEELLASALRTLERVSGYARPRIARKMVAVYRDIYEAESLPAPTWVDMLEETAQRETRQLRKVAREFPELEPLLRGGIMVRRAGPSRYDTGEELRLWSVLHTLSAIPTDARPRAICALAGRLREIFGAERVPIPPWLEALAEVGERESAFSPAREEWEYQTPVPD